jgi:hypothetical protein
MTLVVTLIALALVGPGLLVLSAKWHGAQR